MSETPTTPDVPSTPAMAAPTIVLDQPGGTLTSSGDLIVDNDLSDAEFEAALESSVQAMEEGRVIEGVVVKIDPDEVLLDIGWKSEGVIPVRELSIKADVDPKTIVQVGDVVAALIMNREDELGRLVLSKKRAQYEAAWGSIERIYTEDRTVQGTVIEVVKGGLIVDIGLRGFLPASLVEMRRVRDLTPFIGQTLECKIIELDRNRNNVVLSRRKFLEETQSEFRNDFLNSLKPGEVRAGVVSSIVNFGAFVDLGGVDGLVHVSELSWKHIDHPSEVVEVGDEVEVEVLDVDLQRERVSLSLKNTQEDPWARFAREHDLNSVVPGEVTKLVPFGAFVKVADGIEGLVHISELSDQHVEVPEAVVNVGDKVEVRVIDVDSVRRRVSLSLKQALEPSAAPSPASVSSAPIEQEEAPKAAYTAGSDDEGGGTSAMAAAMAQAGLAKSAAAEVAPEPEPAAEVAPEPEPAAEVAPEPEPAAEVAPEPEPAAEVAPEPEPAAEVAPEPSDQDEAQQS